MKIKVKELIKLLKTLDQEAIIDNVCINPFETKQNSLYVYILENYREIENGRKYNTSRYEINYAEGTIELQHSCPTTELNIDLSSSSGDWKDCIAYSKDNMNNTIKLGE